MMTSLAALKKSQFGRVMITLFCDTINMKQLFFFIFILLFPLSFAAHAKINQPYGLFFVQDNELGEGDE